MRFARRDERGHARSGGFTLIEVVVALVILALALAAVLPEFGRSLRLGSAAEERRVALLAARSILDELGARPDPAGAPLAGHAGAGLRWRAELKPVPLAPEPGQPALPVYEALVELSDGDGRPVASLGGVLLGRPL